MPLLTIVVLVLVAWAQQEVTVSRQSPAIIIEAGHYVSYEATVTNLGDASTGEGKLQAHFVSAAGGKSDSQAEFAVPPLAPGQSKQLHLGPFKVVQAGEHLLYVGMDNDDDDDGDGSSGGGADELADSFVAYADGTGNAAVAGAAIAGAGGVLVAWYLKKKAKRT